MTYLLKSLSKWFLGIFISINPLEVLRNHVTELREGYSKLNRQTYQFRVQMHKLMEQILQNDKSTKHFMLEASKYKINDNETEMVINTRKAARLDESNQKLNALYRKMDLIYQVLKRMRTNTKIMIEDITDQVEVKEKEYQMISTGHSALQTAMELIQGNKNKRTLFDEALEQTSLEISGKVSEMEQLMEISNEFISSIDFQNGIFEEKGLEMLQKWEQKNTNLLMPQSSDPLLDSLNIHHEDRKSFLEPELHPTHTTSDNQTDSNNKYKSFFD